MFKSCFSKVSIIVKGVLQALRAMTRLMLSAICSCLWHVEAKESERLVGALNKPDHDAVQRGKFLSSEASKSRIVYRSLHRRKRIQSMRTFSR